MKRIDELTGLRCIAVSMVVLGHSKGILPGWAGAYWSPVAILGHGETGVELFFVLSGYLIASLLKQEYELAGRIDFWGFYRRRLLRILPAFYFFLAVLVLFSLLGLLDISWPYFVISGTYAWNYAHAFGTDSVMSSAASWYLGHTWSLAMEEQFYWLWPALLLLLLRHNNRWLLPVIILIIPIVRMANYIAFPSIRPQLGMMFHTGIDTILIGCYVAVNRTSLLARLQPFVLSRVVLSMLAIVLLLILPNATAPLGGYWSCTYGKTLEAGLMGMLLLCILAQPSHSFVKILRLRPFVFIGTISYSLYLWQQLFNHPHSPVFLAFPLNAVGAIVAATLSYILIERPFLVLKDRRAKACATPASIVPCT